LQGLQEGIYLYIGKTKKDLETRVKKPLEILQIGKSAVAAHV
jgi:hypothetical protein